MICFADRLESYGDSPALITESEGTISYRELAHRVAAFGARIGAPRKLLLIEAGNAVEPIVAYLAALWGRHPVILAAADSAALNETMRSVFQPDLTYRSTTGGWQLSPAPSPSSSDLHPELALLLSTSGSTGSAKLVRLSLDNVQANAESIAEYLKLTSADRPITSLPVHYSYGLSVLNSHLSVGAAIVLTERSVTENIFWEAVEQHQVTSIAGVPYTYELFERMAVRSRALPSLRTLTQAGGRLSSALVSAYARWTRSRAIDFFVMYGQTEATARIAYLPPALAESHADCIGVPIPGGILELENEQGEKITTPNEVGQLVYRGPNVMLGYATARAHLALGREITMLRTGDLAVQTEAGLFRITGRSSRFSKLFGLRVGFDEIEQRLGQAGLPVYVTGSDQLVAIWSITRESRATVLARLTEGYPLPASCFGVLEGESPPLLASGKIDYRSILAAAERERDKPATALGSADPQERVRSAFRSLRGRPPTLDDSFVTLGGDSLSFIEVSLALERVLGVLPKDWERLTLRELSLIKPGDRRAMVAVPVDIFIRAIAILGVIVSHASRYHLEGSAALLFMVSGLNFARFQATHLIAGRVFSTLRTFAFSILLPYYAVLAVYFTLRRAVDPASALLVSNLFGRFGTFLEPFWYIDALTQVVTLICLLFLVPAVRRTVLQHPWGSAVGLTLAAASTRLLLPDLSAFPEYARRLPHDTCLLFALGWLLFFSRSVRQRAGFSLLFLSAVVFFYSDSMARVAWLAGGILTLTWLRHLVLPRFIGQVVSALGGCSYFIYLVHGVGIMAARHISLRYAWPMSLIFAPACGFIFRWLWQMLTQRMGFFWGKRRVGRPLTQPLG